MGFSHEFPVVQSVADYVLPAGVPSDIEQREGRLAAGVSPAPTPVERLHELAAPVGVSVHLE